MDTKKNLDGFVPVKSTYEYNNQIQDSLKGRLFIIISVILLLSFFFVIKYFRTDSSSNQLNDNQSKLFEKYILNNNVEVKNRLVIAPITLLSSNLNGSINDEEREYLKERGTDIGIYILGATAICQDGITHENQPRAYSDSDIPSLEERAKIIKAQGDSKYS